MVLYDLQASEIPGTAYFSGRGRSSKNVQLQGQDDGMVRRI